jgi:hypothetical protein
MQKFTEAYKKAKEVVEKQEFETEWQTYLAKKCNVGKLFGEKGFMKGSAKAPELFREKLREKVTVGTNVGDVLYAAANGGKPALTMKERAATLKMLRHVYRIAEKGSQDVWVYAPPKSDKAWVFDELNGDAATVKARLAAEDEIFSSEEMKWMSSALQIARKISEDTKSKLGAFFGASTKTKDLVKHWFLDDTCGDTELADAISKLSAGFKKIAVSCGSPTLVFADYPDWRTQRDNYFGAAFRGGEGGGFPVVYLEGAFTRLTGNSGKSWLCAETIIHELSHHEVSTRDHRYDSAGLKPNSTVFPYAKTIDNADSWGYFALDLAGYLSKADHDNTWK